MKKITISNIDIDIHDMYPVGISVSGGADSAVLLYILLKEISQTVHIYTFLGEVKRHIAEPVIDQVVSKCIELTGNSNLIHHKEYIDAVNPQLMHSTLKEKIKNKEVGIIYNGITKFPPDDVIKNFNEKLDHSLYEKRKDVQNRPLYFENNFFYRPFMNMNKKDIFKLYSNLNLLKSLYSITRSCENELSPIQHCGKCFWCEERMWGFGYLE